MIRARFKANADDYRPVNWPVKHPFWCTGSGEGYSIIVAYADDEAEILRNWPEARDIDSEERDSYTFTSRFPKPDWFHEPPTPEWRFNSDNLPEMPTNLIPAQLTALAAQENHDGYDWDLVQEAGVRFRKVLDSHTELLAAIKDDLANRLAVTDKKSCGHDFHCSCASDRLNAAIKVAEVYRDPRS